MQLSRGSLQFTRQLGIGEREHVRCGLLGIGVFHHVSALDQLKGAIRAADKLGMMLRAHINSDKFTQQQLTAIHYLMYDNAAHQLETWSGFSRQQFDAMCKKLEIVITGLPGEESFQIPAITELGILSVWEESGGRFLNGNFQQLNDDQLKPIYPQFYYDTTPFWVEWSA